MEPRDYLNALRRRWLVILGLGLLGALIALAYDSTLPTLYKATSSVFVSTQRGETTSELVQGSTFTQANVQSYARLATMPIVLEPVIAELDLDIAPRALARAITVDTPLNTVIIEITASSPDAAKSAEIADAVTESLSNAVARLSPEGPDGEPAITMTTVSSAQVPRLPYAPNTRFIVLTGLLAGFAAGFVFALASEAFDTRLRNAADLARVTDAPLLGTVSRRRRRGSSGLVMRTDPHGPQAESYRRIRANLEFADVDSRVRALVVTSAVAGEGKSTTSINLALALAERSDRVLLIDADLRRPSIGRHCEIEDAVGLTTVLLGEVAVADAVQRWAGVLDILPSGVVPPNPGQLLGSTAMADLMSELIASYSFIIVDSPPLLPATDALGLAHMTDGSIVVAQYKSTRREQLARAIESLVAVRARVIGVVLDRVPAPASSASYYGYRARDEDETAVADGPQAQHRHDRRDRPAEERSPAAPPPAAPPPAAPPPAAPSPAAPPPVAPESGAAEPSTTR
ncbi:polysaccharide biosynthesis tyrosine autokinase [Agromyces sp. NPDC058484]|uniref:polysaccharide biosynthesis tyrosine autokinase n=1 Tax=Agromyces sp. NPDC058484 TaxID=3346524 RepID=UPI00365A0F86